MMPVCEKCGRQIVWGEDEHGTRIPLDPKPVCYVITSIRRGRIRIRKMQNPKGYVTHFATCPEMNHFSHRGGKPGRSIPSNQSSLELG